MGGGTSEDNNCCNLPLGPVVGAAEQHPGAVLDRPGRHRRARRPRNVLTDGVDTWLVVEWRVNVFGTNDTRVFQTWIGVGGTQDISYAYPANLPADPNGQDYLVGAENAAGEGDVTRFLPTEDQW